MKRNQFKWIVRIITLIILYAAGWEIMRFEVKSYLWGYGTEKPTAKQLERINKAHSLFFRKPELAHGPNYAIFVGAKAPQAVYSYDYNIIYISEHIVNDYSLCGIAAILAHEMAHAEWMNRINGPDRRKHYLVDAEGAKWVGYPTMITALEHLREEYREYFESKKILLSLYFYKKNFDAAQREFNERIKTLKILASSGVDGHVCREPVEEVQ